MKVTLGTLFNSRRVFVPFQSVPLFPPSGFFKFDDFDVELPQQFNLGNCV